MAKASGALIFTLAVLVGGCGGGDDPSAGEAPIRFSPVLSSPFGQEYLVTICDAV